MVTSEESLVWKADGGTQVRGHGREERVRMTLKVSRDSGRTWGQVTVVREDEDLALLTNPAGFPPCACPRCTASGPQFADHFPVVS